MAGLRLKHLVATRLLAAATALALAGLSLGALSLTAVSLTALGLAGCTRLGSASTGSPTKDFAALSAQLQKDMAETEVAKTLGAPPDKADLVNCVDHAGNPWPCRTWIYAGGRPKNNLRVVFYQTSDSAWRVASWDMY